MSRSSDPAHESDQDAADQGASGRNLPLAFASGIVLAGLFLGSLALDPVAFLAFVGVLLVLALLELDIAFRSRGRRPGTPVAIGAGLVMLFGAYLNGASGQTLGLALLLFGAVAWALLDRGEASVGANLGATVLITVWVPFLASFMGLLLRRPDGVWLLIAVVALSVGSDIGAYFVGSRFGRRRMAPSVSPAKSWEGFAGGLVAALVIGLALGAPLVPGLGLVEAGLLAVVVVLASTLGDLTESLVKRDLGVKDLGRMLPGHGGIMDRVDAVIFALPAAHLMLLALGL